jgi:nucleoside-diphosphate-sugar epimerase
VKVLLGNKSVGRVLSDLPLDDPKIRRPDLTKARKTLGYEPSIALEQGLEKTIAYFREIVK